jgi:adenylosuccinate lyase
VPICAGAHSAASTAADLAERFVSTPMIGRTLLQQAVPTTFGLRAATWAAGLDAAASQVEAAVAALPIQLGGAVGTQSAYGGQATAVVARCAELLGLHAGVPWHTVRVPVVTVGAALGALAGVAGKVATDVVLLAQDDIAELSEGAPGRGGSSVMPHKNNPIAAVIVRANVQRTPSLVASLLAAMPQELDRAAGSWHAEWETVSDLLRLTGSAVAWLHDCLTHLRVHDDRMLANLGDRLDSEAVDAAARRTAEVLGIRTGASS